MPPLREFKIIELYGGGGLGYYFVNGHFQRKHTSGLEDEVDGDDNVFGAHLTAGLKFLFTKPFYLGLEGRYIIWTQDAEIQNESGFFKFDMEGYTLSVVLGFRFD